MSESKRLIVDFGEIEIGSQRGSKGYALVTWDQFQKILQESGILLDIHRVAKVKADDRGIHVLTRPDAKK